MLMFYVKAIKFNSYYYYQRIKKDNNNNPEEKSDLVMAFILKIPLVNLYHIIFIILML